MSRHDKDSDPSDSLMIQEDHGQHGVDTAVVLLTISFFNVGGILLLLCPMLLLAYAYTNRYTVLVALEWVINLRMPSKPCNTVHYLGMCYNRSCSPRT